MKRRTFISNSVKLLASTGIAPNFLTASNREVTQITSGDKQHWFGYYDKWQIDQTGRYALGGEVDVFFRSPTMQDKLQVGLIDLQDDNKWKEIGTSHTWGWQQGCMLQWIPGDGKEIIWNDWQDGKYVSKIYNVDTGISRTLPLAVYTLSPGGKFALCVDFDRLQFFRPGYGYPSKGKKNWVKAPEDTGIYKMDLQSGESKLIISYAQLAATPRGEGSTAGYYHWFNHLLINPSGDRFIFLNRSRPTASYEDMTTYLKHNPSFRKKGFSSHYVTRAITANTDGSGIYPLCDSGRFSHFIWNGEDAICAWAVPEGKEEDAFFNFHDRSKKYEPVGHGIMTHNGHNTYVPHTNYEWILNDTYPLGDARLQELYLFHVPTSKKVSLGKFHEPITFKGEWRCDLHPRCDQAGQRVFFDSTHNDNKRQMYMMDIREIVGT